MLTIFTIPKAFAGHVGVIQDNAIGSWVRLGSGCEIILFGDDPGVVEAAARHRVRHVYEIVRTAKGTPLLNDVFAKASSLARHPTLCFVNTDIILFDDVLNAVRRVSETRSPYLMVSRRFDLHITEPMSYPHGWDEALRARARTEGRKVAVFGSDIFVYPRGLFATVPPFAIGRGFWDNWLMRYARESGADLIDATPAVTAVHQDHDYAHVDDMPIGSSAIHDLLGTEESARNTELSGGYRHLYTLDDATSVLTADGRLVSTLDPRYVHRRLRAPSRRILIGAYHGLISQLRRVA